MKKIFAVGITAAVFAMSLTGCQGKASYKDGTYEGVSSVYEGDEEGNGDGYGVVSLTIKNGEVSECIFTTYQTDGTLKDENYGKQNGEIANADFYNKAQRAVVAGGEYAKQYAETGDLKEVDAISGATISYNEFKEAVDDALKKAKA